MKVALIKSDLTKKSQIDLDIPEMSDFDMLKIAVLKNHSMQNSRQGTKAVKDRAQVSGHARKPYKQKGTGNARQGSTKGPHFRGGGVSHGPRMDTVKSYLNKKQKKNFLLNMINRLVADQKFVFVDFENNDNIRNLMGEDRGIFFYDQSNKVSVNKIKNLAKLEVYNIKSISPSLLLDKSNVFIDLKCKEYIEQIFTTI